MAQQTFRVTYATMKSDDEDLQRAYDEGIETAKSWLGGRHPFYVNGEARESESWFEERSPIDHDMVIGTFAQASREDAKDAVAAAKAAFDDWSTRPWKERVALLRKAADLITARDQDLAAHKTPQNLGLDVVTGSHVLANSGEVLRLVVQTLRIQRLTEKACP